MPHRGAWVAAAQNKRVLRAFIAADVYVYYPDYGVYYNRTRQRYFYLVNGVWVTSPVAPKVPAGTFMTALAVEMPFHDAPALHHANVLKAYPKTSGRKV